MSAIGSRLVLMLLGMVGAPGRFNDFPAEAEVIAEALDVFDEPDTASTATSRLRRGDRVVVRDADRTGWLTIDPPPGSFCWIDQWSIAPTEAPPDEDVGVVADRASIRSGHPSARMPGSPRVLLRAGTLVRLLDRPPLHLGQGRERRTWCAIEPPQGDVRHIRAEGVRPVDGPGPATTTSAPGPSHGPDEGPGPATLPIAEVRASFAPQVVPPPTSPEVADAIAAIESTHRAILREPVDRWRLEGVRQRYEALLRGVNDAGSGNAIRERLDVVARHEAMARDARLIATLLERSRRRDSTLALAQRRLAEARRPQSQPYDVQGLIQPSSRKVGGQKVFALIGGDGTTQAYLEIPPGIEVKGLLTRRVGIRGIVRYNEALRARLINVRDVEPLDQDQ